jgi:hypothetical protein
MVQLGQLLHFLRESKLEILRSGSDGMRPRQVILTKSLEDPSFGIPGIKYLNYIMQYGYLGTVIACFLFSMGNRPQG